MSEEVSLPVDNQSKELPPSEHGEAKDSVPPLLVPKNQTRGVYRDATRKGSASQLDTSQTHLSGMPSGRLVTQSMANFSHSDVESMQEIRRKREEERLKELNFFRNQKQAQIAKNLEKKKQQMAEEKRREEMRKQRHESQKREIAVFKQVQTERRKSQDEEWSKHMRTQRTQRVLEVQEFLKNRQSEYLETFKKGHADFQRKQKEKARIKEIKEKGLSKAKESHNDQYVGDWSQVKAERTAEQKVLDLYHSKTIQEIFAAAQIELKLVYDYYSSVHIDCQRNHSRV